MEETDRPIILQQSYAEDIKAAKEACAADPDCYLDWIPEQSRSILRSCRMCRSNTSAISNDLPGLIAKGVEVGYQASDGKFGAAATPRGFWRGMPTPPPKRAGFFGS